jgi:hypothetical protein
MERDIAVEIMCNTVDEFNRYQAAQNGMPSEQIEEYITQTRDQMAFVNGIIYDALKSNGIIN